MELEELSNEDLLRSALSDDQPQEAEAPQAEATEAETTSQPRDDHGRFAEKQAEPEPKPEAQPAKVDAKEEGQIPSWRLRELREERDALRQQLAEVQRRPVQPQPEQPKPDIFENPDKFVRAEVGQAVDPIRAEINGIREFYSQARAIDKHGEEKVQAARQALEEGMRKRDPEAWSTYQRAMQSMDPYGDIVSWHSRSVVAADPEGYFNRTLEEKLKDEKFVASLAEKLRPAPSSDEKPRPVVRMPPSMNRVANASATVADDPGGLSNEELLAYALR